MKNKFVLYAQISATRHKIMEIGSDICYNLAENKKDMRIATMLLNADDWLSKAMEKLMKEDVI